MDRVLEALTALLIRAAGRLAELAPQARQRPAPGAEGDTIRGSLRRSDGDRPKAAADPDETV